MRLLSVILLAGLCNGQAVFRAQNVTVGGASYTGFGDVTSSAVVYGGVWAYNSAARGTKAVNLCDSGDAHCADANTDATTGALVVPSSNPNCTTTDTCTVKTVYDQSGNNGCGGPCDMTQATEANRPTLCINCVGGTHPGIKFSGTKTLLGPAYTGSVVTQPYTGFVGASRTANFTSFATPWGVDVGDVQIGFANSADTAFLYAGSVLTASASAADNSMHSLGGMGNATSKISVDGAAATTGSASTNNLFNGSTFKPCMGNCGNAYTGIVMEGAWWSGDHSADFSSLSTNQHSRGGF